MSAVLVALLFAIRPVDPLAVDALDVAMRSTIVGTLIDGLEASNLVVHIQTTYELPPGIAGTTQFVVARGPYRYVRIKISSQLPREWRAVILAHELQHAREIAECGATDVASLAEALTRGGRRDGNRFETRAAIDVERAVRRELERGGLQAEPVIKFHH